MFDKLRKWFRSRGTHTTVTYSRATLTPEQAKAFDKAFADMGKAFDSMDAAFRKLP